MFANECDCLVDLATWHPEFVSEHTLKFPENCLAHHKPMFGKHDPEHVLTQATGGECRHQDIGIEQNPHAPEPVP